jgi:CO dehydrogenase/acetyl-CoA synthase gamma subunit (corrinoid Fe-S protein)
MGCTQSVPKEPRAPLEPVPDLEAVKKMVAEAISGEPLLTSKDSNMLDMEKAVHLVLKQTGTHSNGKTFEISPFDAAEANKDDLLIEPALLFGGQVVRRMLQDLVVMRRNKRIDEEQTPICFAVKDAPVGINFFKILTTKPVREGQGM